MGRLDHMRIAVMVGVSVGLLADTGNAEILPAELPTLNIEKGVYFKSNGDDPVLVDPGEYVVEAAEQGLQLIPTTGEEISILIEAEKTAVEESLVFSTANPNPDLQHVVVVMPDGIVYETVGSQTGIWPRGFLQKWRQSRKGRCPPNARCKPLKPKGSKSLTDFHKAEHLKTTAKTLCQPIKDPKLKRTCENKITLALVKTRFSPPTKRSPFKNIRKGRRFHRK